MLAPSAGRSVLWLSLSAAPSGQCSLGTNWKVLRPRWNRRRPLLQPASSLANGPTGKEQERLARLIAAEKVWFAVTRKSTLHIVELR